MLRFDNKQHLWIYTKKQIWVCHWFCLREKVEIAYTKRLIKECEIGFSACIDFIFASVTSVILVSIERTFVCLLRSVVCSWGDQDQHS